MKYLAYLVIAASLVVGVIGAMTAYLPRIDEQDPRRLVGLHLNAPAGKTTDAAGQPAPLVADETELTSQHIAQLRAAGVQRVRVREFSLQRWTGWWMFLAGVAGLLTGGLYLRFTSKRRPAVSAFGTGGRAMDPAEALERMRQEVQGLLQSAPARAPAEYAGQLGYLGQDMCALVIDRVGELQKTLMPAFISARPQLVARLGLSGYAQLMDAYASAERALNRAWSAAADDDEVEAITSLERGLALLDASAARLRT